MRPVIASNFHQLNAICPPKQQQRIAQISAALGGGLEEGGLHCPVYEAARVATPSCWRQARRPTYSTQSVVECGEMLWCRQPQGATKGFGVGQGLAD